MFQFLGAQVVLKSIDFFCSTACHSSGIANASANTLSWEGGRWESSGWELLYLKAVGNFPGIETLLGNFAILLSPFLCPTQSHWPSLCWKKNGLSRSHLVPETILPTFGLFFLQNLSLDNFEAFYTNFLLDFRSWWSPFSLFLRHFWLLIMTIIWIQLGPFFHCMLNPLPKVPPLGME